MAVFGYMKLSNEFSQKVRNVACAKNEHWFNNWIVRRYFEDITSYKAKTDAHQSSTSRYNEEL